MGRTPVVARTSIKRGQSLESSPVRAAREFHAAVDQPDLGLVVFFCSTSYELGALATEMRRLFGTTHVVGCTTAGEIGPAGYVEGSITGFSMGAADGCAVSVRIPDVADFQMSRGHAAADEALAALVRRSGESIDPAQTFALLLSDGMSTNEEALLASLYARMHNVALLGGSAGDNLRLQQTFVYHEGAFHADSAVLTLLRTRHSFKTYRCQHFSGSDRKMVVTQADPARRVVSEINAEPAGKEYARIAGLDVRHLTPMRFAECPVMVRVGGDYYVRSIQKMDDSFNLKFFCAIDEGVVLTLARREDMLDNLETFFSRVRGEMGEPQLVIGFDCILRGLEADQRRIKPDLGRVLAAHNVVGFSTYGEQFGPMHVNQTFTALVIGSA